MKNPVHAMGLWDVRESFRWRDIIHKKDPDLGRPGWCWNSAIAVVFAHAEPGTFYVEGWLHNRFPEHPIPVMPHAWTIMPDGRIIDTVSGAKTPDQAARGSMFIFYEPVRLWTPDELCVECIVSDVPPFTPHFVDWDPDDGGYPIPGQQDLFEEDWDPFALPEEEPEEEEEEPDDE